MREADEHRVGAAESAAGALLEMQLGSLRELDAMSRALADMSEGDPQEILRTLAGRERLLREIASRQGEIGGEIVGGGDGALRGEIEALAAAVYQRDERTLGAIVARRDELLAELRSVDRSREAIRAYGPDQRDRRRYRDDSA